jgi:hypothetical protein
MLRRQRSRVRSAVLVAAAVVGGLLPATPAHAVQECLLVEGCYGSAYFEMGDNLHAVGANLMTRCLYAKDWDNGHSATHQLRLWVRPPGGYLNLLAEGFLTGNLYGTSTTGFVWMWQDVYDSGGFFQHYVSGGVTDRYFNATLRWGKNSQGIDGWNVYRDTVKVGWSGVGAYPQRTDIVAATDQFDGYFAINAEAVDWQYLNRAETQWNWITAPTWSNTSNITVTSAQARVSVRTPYFPCGGPVSLTGTGEAAQNTQLGPSTALPENRAMLKTEAGARQYLTTHADDIARRFGVSDKGAKRYLKANHQAVVKRQGNGTEVADNRAVYVVQVDGAFTKAVGKDRTVKGNVLELVFDAETGQLTDLGIRAADNNFGTLGAVQTLS